MGNLYCGKTYSENFLEMEIASERIKKNWRNINQKGDFIIFIAKVENYFFFLEAFINF